MITVTPDTYPLAIDDEVVVTTRRPMWPLAGALAGVASLVGAMAGLGSVTDEDAYLDGVGIIDQLD
ncbi:MAG: hypothetical protein ACLGIC_10225, partial [Acidimicrobiia bacterium]